MSRQMYADSSLVRANVSGRNLSRSGMSVEEFKEKAVEEMGCSCCVSGRSTRMASYQRE